VYLLCGLAGDGLHEVMVGLFHPQQFSLGASGAIMGLAGAYLYLFPFARICIFWGWNWWRYSAGLGPVSEWQAQWVILYYLGFDILEGFLTSTAGFSNGVANFAHIGGAGAGLLLVMALRARRDTEEASDAQAMRSEFGGDYRSLSLPDLEALVQREPDNMDLVTTFCQKALFGTLGGTAPLARSLFLEKADKLVQSGDPDTVTKLALLLSTGPGEVPSGILLRLAARQEREGDFGQADQLMRRVLSFDDRSPDTEMVWGAPHPPQVPRRRPPSRLVKPLPPHPRGPRMPRSRRPVVTPTRERAPKPAACAPWEDRHDTIAPCLSMWSQSGWSAMPSF
uniref:rhomboid family intramembrane serine protease n=1 Tax=Armatimonas sp. TaxID=1872638 RepID=UPI0037510E55